MFCAIAFIIVSFYLFIMVFTIEKHFKQLGGLNPFTSSSLFDPSLSLLLWRAKSVAKGVIRY